MQIDKKRKVAQISLDENALIIIKDGKIKKIPAIDFGEDKIVWKNGQVLDIIRSERVRV